MSEVQRYTYNVQLSPDEVEAVRDMAVLDRDHVVESPRYPAQFRDGLNALINALDGPPVDEGKPEEQSLNETLRHIDGELDQIQFRTGYMESHAPPDFTVTTAKRMGGEIDSIIENWIRPALRRLNGTMPKEQSTSSEAPCTESFVPSVWMQLDHNLRHDDTEWSVYTDTGNGDAMLIAFSSNGSIDAIDTTRKIYRFLVEGDIRALTDIVANIHRPDCRCPEQNDNDHRIGVISELVDTYRRIYLGE